MQILHEDLYSSGVDYKFFTSNGVVKTNGELVMGAGTAKVVRDLYPSLPRLFGSLITTKYTKSSGVYKYGLLIDTSSRIGCIQTKYHFKDNSNKELIEYSLSKLSIIAEKNPKQLFGIPFPGIGLGRLEVKDIEYMLVGLPINVFIFTQ